MTDYRFTVLHLQKTKMIKLLEKCPYAHNVESGGYSQGSTCWDIFAECDDPEQVRDWIWDQENAPGWISFEEYSDHDISHFKNFFGSEQ